MAKQHLIFATRSDLESLLRILEPQRQLQFVEVGLFDSPDPKRIESLLADPDLGRVAIGDHNHAKCYLIASREIPIEVRLVPQRSGGVKYAIDQLLNRKTIIFRPGGAFNEACLITGEIGTVSDDPISVELFKWLSQELRRQFTKIDVYYVGREAAELLEQGWRLTSNISGPADTDLKRK